MEPTITVRLVWDDSDRTPVMLQDLDPLVSRITLQLPDGNHHFATTDMIAMDGYVIFREE